MVVAIQLVRVSAYESFEQASLINNANFTHQIVNETGTAISYRNFVQLKKRLPFIKMSPVVDFRAGVETIAAQNSVYVLGIDPISRPNSINRPNGADFDLETFLRSPGVALANKNTTTKLKLAENNEVVLSIGGTQRVVSLLKPLPNQDQSGGIANDTLIIDIATAQELLGIGTAFTRIDVELTGDEITTVLAELPDGFNLIDNQQQVAQLRNMTRAFYTNLTALSLMALMMGMFLIYNTETFIVLQRQQMIARLKSLGVSNQEILRTSVIEAVALGSLGSVCGLVFGYLLAHGLLRAVSITLNDLYFESSASEVVLAPPVFALGMGLGILATVLAAALPAHTAANTPFISALHRTSNSTGTTRNYLVYFLLAGAIFSLGAMLVLYFYSSVNSGFVGIACLLLGAACFCLPALHTSSNILQNHALSQKSSFLFEKIGLRAARLSLSRTGTACAALMIAIASAIGIGVMVASFRVSVSEWLQDSLRAEFYLSANFSVTQQATRIAPQIKPLLLNIEGVEMLSSVTRERVKIKERDPDRSSVINLSAFELNRKARDGFVFLDQTAFDWAAWKQSDAIIITEPFAHHYRYQRGDFVELITPSGTKPFLVMGVYKDYASERGSISMSRGIFEKYWLTRGYDGMGIYTDRTLGISQLAEVLSSHQEFAQLSVVAASELLSESLRVFDRTFLVTNLLKVITIVVAFIGIVGALLAHQIERSHEYGIFRALGFSRWEIIRVTLAQTLCIGLTAVVIAIPAGLGVAKILIAVINPRSFGWTMTTVIPPETLVNPGLIALAATLIAGIVPALRVAKMPPGRALRFE